MMTGSMPSTFVGAKPTVMYALFSLLGPNSNGARGGQSLPNNPKMRYLSIAIAVARLPGYVVAHVHLTELEIEMGQDAQAMDG